jgi:ribonuclease I
MKHARTPYRRAAHCRCDASEYTPWADLGPRVAKPPTFSAPSRLVWREKRSYEVFLPGKALARSEWNEHVACVIRVQRDTLKRSAATGLWKVPTRRLTSVTLFCRPRKLPARSARASFAEDASRIRKNPVSSRGYALSPATFYAAIIPKISPTPDIASQSADLLQSIKFM